MVTGTLTGRMGSTLILPVKVPVTITTMLNFDGLNFGPNFGVDTCEQGFMAYSHFPIPTPTRLQWKLIRVGL